MRNSDSELDRLHEVIRSNTRALIITEEIKVPGKPGFLLGDSLMRQLRDAVANGRESGGSRGKSTNRLPISVAAHDLLTSIDKETRYWDRSDRIEDRISATGSLLRSNYRYAPRVWADLTGKWVKQIRELFDPPKRYHISAACPRCDSEMVSRYSEVDEQWLMVPALQVMSGHFGLVVRCINCNDEWSKDHFGELAAMIGAVGIVDDDGRC